jgi:SAM-dependent methyltransferase
MNLPDMTDFEVAELVTVKYGNIAEGGWGPRLRRRFGYCTPDDWYEATLCRLVNAETEWLDVGCGRAIFPSNVPTAVMLAERCRLLAGVDPSDNVDENPLIQERAKCLLQDYRTERTFDLITLRMVAEHITDPPAATAALSRLTKPGGLVVIYTVHKWSPVSLISAMTPMAVHHRAKKYLWEAEEKDTFPTAYRMNTRATLHRLFRAGGFTEENFRYLADTRSTLRFKKLNTFELWAWRTLRSLGLPYPESCLLGIYRKQG